MGWTEDVMFKIGIVEVAIAILFLIPRPHSSPRSCSQPTWAVQPQHMFVWASHSFPDHHRSCRMDRTRTRKPDVFRLAFGSDKPDSLESQP